VERLLVGNSGIGPEGPRHGEVTGTEAHLSGGDLSGERAHGVTASRLSGEPFSKARNIGHGRVSLVSRYCDPVLEISTTT